MAISKERLEELIEQGATIWTNDFEEIKLDKNTCEVCEVKTFSGEHLYWVFDFEYEFNNVKYNAKIDLDELEEDVEKCKWQREFGCIERVERLKLPTWEEFDDKTFIWFVDKNQNQCCLYYRKCAKQIVINVSGEVIEIGELTKENYLIACMKAKELFLNGYNND